MTHTTHQASHQTDQLMTQPTQLKMTVYTSVFVAFISIGAFIAIPIGPVPIVLQNMFVLLAALLLGPVWGLACIGVYLLIGLAGLPVFSQGGSGLGKLLGPTGGYLLGYIPCVAATAALSRVFDKKLPTDIFAMVVGSLIVYAAGVPWLKVATGMSFEKALALGMFPFIIGDLIKIVAAAFLAKALRPLTEL